MLSQLRLHGIWAGGHQSDQWQADSPAHRRTNPSTSSPTVRWMRTSGARTFAAESCTGARTKESPAGCEARVLSQCPWTSCWRTRPTTSAPPRSRPARADHSCWAQKGTVAVMERAAISAPLTWLDGWCP